MYSLCLYLYIYIYAYVYSHIYTHVAMHEHMFSARAPPGADGHQPYSNDIITSSI